jgi:large subunit ribosomal protein L30
VANLKITLRRSTIGQKPKARATARSLGLRKIRQSTVRPDSPALRGMIRRISHLVDVEETE